MSGRHLTFVVPGVLLSGSEKQALEQVVEGAPAYPHVPAIECLLSRAHTARSLSPSLEHDLFALFGAPVSANDDLPVAAATRHHDMDGIHSGWYLRADPVHVQAGIDSLIMFGNDSLAISAHEAEQLVEELNQHFSADGWQLEALHTHRWYLQLLSTPDIRTSSLGRVTGRSIQPFLPQGGDASKWRGYLNEVQMVLHTSTVNQAREEKGEPVINSVWFWGGGKLPGDMTSSLDAVWSEDVLTHGLAMAANVNPFPLPDTFDAWSQQAPAEGCFLLSTQQAQQALVSGDYQRWHEVLKNIEMEWIEPMFKALKTGELSSISFYPGNGYVYRAERRDVRRWWKRCRPLAAFEA